ncbi:MAG: polymer-forming cytoskeletal protein [Pararhodobacter sp.]|nr:polymer-forming cytoskeletal protein [Pararhodobacter sp.]
MFSKSRIHDKGPKAEPARSPESAAAPQRPSPDFGSSSGDNAPFGSHSSKQKPAASVLASDLTVTGNLRTTGDIVIEGIVDGDIRAHLLTVGESATIRGEVVADDIVINGRVIGRVRGLKVRLTSTARVEGDIIHKTIAIESGAHFEGSVQRQDDPLAGAQQQAAQAGRPAGAAAANSAPAAPAAAPAAAARPAAPASGNLGQDARAAAPKPPAPAAKGGE